MYMYIHIIYNIYPIYNIYQIGYICIYKKCKFIFDLH